jgi:hypothetical protein
VWAPALALLAVAAVTLTRAPAADAAGAAVCPPPVQPPPVTQVRRPKWLSGVLVTEYFPAPERFFDGRLVRVPGLAGRHRIDWLYSSRGLAMQGAGIGSDGRVYRFTGPYTLTWRNARGGSTYPCRHSPGHWTNGRPAWIGPTWVDTTGRVTYPLPGGHWSNGPGVRVLPAKAPARFAAQSSRPFAYWRNVAVDPRLIPRGSSVFVPAYCGTPSKGWFRASDTGGAILGLHVDVFRAPPQERWESQSRRDQRIFVVPPGHRRPAAVRCAPSG